MDSPIADSPATDSAGRGSPIVDPPVADSPTVDSPVVEPMIVDSPSVDVQPADSPSVEVQPVDSSIVDFQTVESQIVDSPIAELAGHLVAVLFVSGGSLKLEEAARALGVNAAALDEPLQLLRRQPPLGLMLQRHGDELELVSHPRSAAYVEALLGLDRPVKLSRAALETLAIVAYRHPVTRGDVEGVRGVNSDSAVTTLLNRGLIAEVGRKETVGRPALYATTPEFLQHLGIDSLDALPPLPE